MKKWLSFAVLALIALAALSSLPHAQPQKWDDSSQLSDVYDPAYKPVGDQSATWFRHWYWIAMAAVAMCLFANILVYVMAHVFHMPNWERFAVSEFWQVTISALIIVNIVWLVDSGFDYVMKIVLPDGTTTLCRGAQKNIYTDTNYRGPIQIIQCKLQDKMDYMYQLYNNLVQVNKEVEWQTTVSIILFNIPIFYGDWISSWHDQMEKAHTIAHRVLPMAISVEAQYMFMDYIANNMLAIILPLGIILRIIPMFRGIGGFLMALSLGFYAVFPLSYIMLDPTTVRADPDNMIVASNLKEKPCYTSFSGMTSAITLASFMGSGQTMSNIDINQLGREIARLQIETTFLPLAALAATIIFIQAATPFFGGDSGEIVHFIAKVI